MLRVLRSAKVSSLLAVLSPSLFKLFSPRFKSGLDTFNRARAIMSEAIRSHQTAADPPDDFITAYLEEVRRTQDEASSFHQVPDDGVVPSEVLYSNSELTPVRPGGSSRLTAC